MMAEGEVYSMMEEEGGGENQIEKVRRIAEVVHVLFHFRGHAANAGGAEQGKRMHPDQIRILVVLRLLAQQLVQLPVDVAPA
jgi:hypothetical protein